MKMINGNLYLSISEMESMGFSKTFLYTATKEYRKGQRKSYANMLDPDDNSISLVSYDSIPESTRIEKAMPGKADLISSHVIKDMIKKDPDARAFYLDIPHAHPKASEYQTTVSYLDFVAPATLTFARSLGYDGVDPLYQTIMQLMLQEKLSVWQITNLDRFKRKLSPFKAYFKNPTEQARKKALNSLVSKQYGKKNAAKIKSDDQQAKEMRAVILNIYADPKKYSVEDTHLIYTNIAKKKYQEYIDSKGKEGWNEKCFVTAQTLHNVLQDPANKQVWFLSRFGGKVYKNTYEPNTKTLAASFAFAKVVIDGTPLHRYYMDHNSVFQRVHVYFVLDEYSWCILGVGISLKGENSGQVLQALRASCQNAALFAGIADKAYIPLEVLSDNSAPNSSYVVKNAYEVMGTIDMRASVGNAKAKRVEPFNRHFNSRWLKYHKGFTGSMMSTDKNNQVNEEELQKLVRSKDLPTLEETLRELQDDVQNWNHDRSWKNEGVAEELRRSPIEKFRDSFLKTLDRQRELTPTMDIEAFYWTPAKAVQVPDTHAGTSRKMRTVYQPTVYQYTNNGFRIQRKSPLTGEDLNLEFDIVDPEFNARYIGQEFTLKIEPNSSDHAYLYQNGRPVCDDQGNRIKAERKEVIHAATADRVEGEGKRLAAKQQAKKAQKQLVKSRLEDIKQEVKAIGITESDIINPRLFGMKDHIDRVKIARAEALVNSRQELAEPEIKDEVEPKKESETINRYEL
jgi:hypothetical protein